MQILVIRSFLSRSLLKQKSTLLFIIISLALLVTTYLISDVNIAARYKLFEDVLLSSQMFILHMAAFFYAFDYLQKERIGGIFILPFSTGISRLTYYMGVWLALVSVVALLTLIFIGIDIGFLFLVEGAFVGEILWQIVLYFISSVILLSLVLMFSQYVSIMNAMVYSSIFFMVGNALDEIYYYAYVIKEDATLEKMASVMYYFLPNFSYFDFQTRVVSRIDLCVSVFYLQPLIYGSLIVAIILGIGYFKFSKRVLKVGE